MGEQIARGHFLLTRGLTVLANQGKHGFGCANIKAKGVHGRCNYSKLWL